MTTRSRRCSTCSATTVATWWWTATSAQTPTPPCARSSRPRTSRSTGSSEPKTWAAVVVTVQKGMTNEAVKGVQQEAAFRDQSGNPQPALAIDGIGPKTEAFVKGFQEALHTDIPSVAVDGIVGPVTWRALVSGMLSSRPRGEAGRAGCAAGFAVFRRGRPPGDTR